MNGELECLQLMVSHPAAATQLASSSSSAAAAAAAADVNHRAPASAQPINDQLWYTNTIDASYC